MSNRVWITGTDTPLGRGVKHFFRAAGVEVAEKGYRYDEIDYASLEAFEEREGPFSHIIHCSMAFEPELAESNPLLVRCKDEVMPLSFIRLAKERACRFFAIASPCVFSGALASRDYTEKYPARPVNALGRIQRDGERAILAADPSAVILRTGWLYGCSAEEDSMTEADSLISEIIHAGKAKASRVVSVPDDAVVSPTWIESIARIVLDMTLPDVYSGYETGLSPIPGGIYHYADWGRATLEQFAAETVRIALARGLIDHPVEILVRPASAFPGRASRPLHQHLSSQKLMRSMVLFQHPWQACLEEYFKKNTISGLFSPVNQAARDDALLFSASNLRAGTS